MFWYVTVATGVEFIRKYTYYSVKSLLNAGVSPDDIYCAVNTKDDYKEIKKFLPQLTNDVPVLGEDISQVYWSYLKGRRKFVYFKAAAMHKIFGKPKQNKYMVHFDGDVLWYSDPFQFLDKKKHKTWFHHGKDLQKRCPVNKKNIDVKNYKSLCRYIDPAWAYLFIKYGLSHNDLPEREVVSGFYILHPNDHEKLLLCTYQGCKMISKMFKSGFGKDSAGEQKPMNAALCKLKIDWHGGSKFFCPEHVDYFEHFFGKLDNKGRFHKKAKQIGV